MNFKKNSLLRVTYGGILTALILLAMVAASAIPATYLGSVAVCSLFVTVALIECRRTGAVLVFASSALLGFFLIPDKSVPLLFVCFFGYYPIAKSSFEQMKTRKNEWVCKMILVFLVVTLIELEFSAIALSRLNVISNKFILIACLCIVFIMYDLGLTQFINFYYHRISKYLHR